MASTVVLREARGALGDLLNCESDEVVFGPSATAFSVLQEARAEFDRLRREEQDALASLQKPGGALASLQTAGAVVSTFAGCGQDKCISRTFSRTNRNDVCQRKTRERTVRTPRPLG